VCKKSVNGLSHITLVLRDFETGGKMDGIRIKYQYQIVIPQNKVPFLNNHQIRGTLSGSRSYENRIRAGFNERPTVQDQVLDMQLDELKLAKCQQIFQEKISSGKERPQLLKMLEMLREGDTVVVYKLDRLGRSLRELVNLIAQFEERKIAFVSLKDAIDTSTAQGPVLFEHLCFTGRI
jgi:hypothetical protein